MNSVKAICFEGQVSRWDLFDEPSIWIWVFQRLEQTPLSYYYNSPVIPKVCSDGHLWSWGRLKWPAVFFYLNQYFVLRGALTYFKWSVHQKSLGTTTLVSNAGPARQLAHGVHAARQDPLCGPLATFEIVQILWKKNRKFTLLHENELKTWLLVLFLFTQLNMHWPVDNWLVSNVARVANRAAHFYSCLSLSQVVRSCEKRSILSGSRRGTELWVTVTMPNIGLTSLIN